MVTMGISRMVDVIPNPLVATCPSREILSVIGDKWSLLIIRLLTKGPMRNAELIRAIDGISQKVLTQALKRLEQYTLIERRDYQEVPPRVDYRLTDLGQSLADVMLHLDGWVVDNFETLVQANRAAR